MASPLTITYQHHNSCINFLDLSINKRDDNLVYFKTYQKSLNNFTYLPLQSLHPKYTISGYIHSELLRLRRICTFETDFFIRDLFLERLIERGFSRQLLEDYFLRHYYRSIFPSTKESINDDKSLIIFTVPYTLSTIYPSIRNRLSSFQEEIIPGYKIMLTYKLQPSISQLSSRSNISTQHLRYLDELVWRVKPPQTII